MGRRVRQATDDILGFFELLSIHENKLKLYRKVLLEFGPDLIPALPRRGMACYYQQVKVALRS